MRTDLTPTATCERCGQAYYASPGELAAARYCSWDCRYPERVKACDYCAQAFRVSTSEIKRGKRFCSWGCRVEGLRKERGTVDPNPSGLCLCGCGGSTTITINGTHRQYLNRHHNRLARVIRPERYEVDSETGCWNWKDHRNRSGYGVAGHRRKVTMAHRISWIEHRGEIPDGYHVDHLCFNPACVNPDHLEPVTPAENTRRARQNKLTHEDVAEIRRLRNEGWKNREVAEKFGIHLQYVSMIFNGRAWREDHG